MQTLPNPISQISSPNATPGPANRSLPASSGADGDFQRTLNRQIEQRQASRNQAQAQAPATRPPAAPAARPAEAAATPDKQAASSETATKDSAATDDAAPEAAPATAQPHAADPAAEMLALVGNIQLAMQPPAAAGKTAPELAARAGIKADARSLAATQLLATGQGTAQADEGDFAASLGHAQGKAAATPAG